MKTKSLPFKVKAAGEEGGLKDGQFEAYASVFNNRDSYGDVMRKGSFKNTLAEWFKEGQTRTLPLLWGHNLSDPNFNLGGVFDAKEDDNGLRVKAEFDLDNPTSAQVYRLVKSGRVSELSFAFDYLKYQDVEPDAEDNEFDGKWYRNVEEVKLYEVSVVPIGANPETEVLAVKSALDVLTRGHAEGKRNEQFVKSARGILVSALEALDSLESGKKESSGHGPTPEEKTSGSSGFNPSDPLVAKFQFARENY
ncbi:capsid maturation protease [Gordonia phage Ghobes]|uniref:Capsid maturation protease n=1 Tax=Gordonia phage Ghobes TaxID=1887647 RepID=A0A1B3B010_9CAUD|nr:head maturation protease [Gordonia phage Ghobes]AOE44357.1 capsid maturation protease [Gordonia phage Ghobes]